MRALLALLLVANLAFFALSRGWLEPLFVLSAQGEREPQRLAAQLDPQAIRLLNPNSASSALATVQRAAAENAPTCVQAGPFTAQQVDAAEADLTQAQLPGLAWTRTQTYKPGSWWVLLGKFPDRAALLRRQDELRSQRFEVEEIGEAAGQPQALSLGRFDDPGAAEAALAQLRQRGLRGATVVMQSPPQTQYWLRVPQADGATRASLAQLPQAAPLGAFAPCAKAP